MNTRVEIARTIAKNIDRDFIAEDGGFCLEPKTTGEREPFPGQTLRTASCDNATLFKAHYEMLLYLLGVLRIDDGDYIRSLERPETKGGIYFRNPGRSQDTNSMDEYIGICALSSIFHLHYPFDICRMGEKTGYMFNVVDPNAIDIHQWRQGVDITVYQLSANQTPTPINLVWFVLGTLWAVFQPRTNASDKLLNWLRLETINCASKRFTKDLDPFQVFSFRVAKLLRVINGWDLSLRCRGVQGAFASYFGSSHPLTQLAQLLESGIQ